MDRRQFIGTLAAAAMGDAAKPLPPTAGPMLKDVPVWSTPYDAVQEVMADLGRLNEADWPFVRYVWVQSGDPYDFKAASHLLALVSRSAVVRQYPVVGSFMLRADVRWFGQGDEVQEYIDVLEDFQYDPSFARLTTRDTLDQLITAGEVLEDFRFPRWVRQWGGDDKVGWTRKGRKLIMRKLDDKVVVVRENGNLPEAAGLSKVQEACQTLAPVIESRYLQRALRTIKDRDGNKENLYSTVWGGRYWELRGIRASQKKGRTDLDQFLIDFGSRPFAELVALRTTGRVVLNRSGITRKPRMVIYAGTGSVQPGTASGVVFITLDIRDQDVDHGDRAQKNLLTFRIRAYEVIVVGQNGHQVYGLFGEQGQRLEEADAKVAADEGDLHRLDGGAISCASCHGAKSGGWHPLPEDGFDRTRQVNILTDLTDPKRSRVDILDFLQGTFYPGPDLVIRRANNDNGEAVRRSIGGWKPEDKLLDLAKKSSAQLKQIRYEEQNDPVTVKVALQRLGLPGRNDQKELDKLFPPNGDGIEDPCVAELKADRPVTPQDWALSYSDLVWRAWKDKMKQ